MMVHRGMIGLVAALCLTTGPAGQGSRPDREPPGLPEGSLEQSGEWLQYSQDQRIRLSHPRSFKPTLHRQGRVQVVGNRGEMGPQTPYVLVQPFISHRGETARAYFKRVILPTYMRLADPTVERIAAADPGRVTALIRYAIGNIPRRVLVHCSLQGRSGMAYFLAATTLEFPELRPQLARIAMSIRYGPVEDPTAAPGTDPLGGLPFVTWTKDKDKAFSCRVPIGWLVESAIVKRPRLEPLPTLVITSPDHRIRLFLNHRKCTLFRLPDPELEVKGCFEGRWYAPDSKTSIQIRSYQAGHRFVARGILPFWSGLEEVRSLAGIPAGPTLVKELDELSLQENRERKVQAGTLVFRGTLGGRTVLGLGLCSTQSWTNSFGQGHWNTQGLCGWLAAPGLHRQATAALRKVLDSFRINPRWADLQPGWSRETATLRAEVFHAMARSLDLRHPALQKAFTVLAGECPAKGDLEFWQDPTTGEAFREARGHNWFWRRVPGRKTRKDLAPPDLDLTPLVRF